jgi:hypothetical protein
MNLQQIYNKVLNSVRKAYISLSNDDSGDYPTAQVTYQGKQNNALQVSPYGLNSNPPEETLAILGRIGNEENLTIIPYACKERFKNLKKGEVTLGSPATGSYVKFLADGGIEILAKNNIEVTVTGDCNLIIKNNININVTGDCNLTANNVKATATNDLEMVAKKITLTADDIEWICGSYNFTFGTGGVFDTNAKVNLGSGGAAIARKGDQVQIGSDVGTIIEGSSNNTSA